jgi:hypothetical protein
MIAIGDIVTYNCQKYLVFDIDNIDMSVCISQPDTNGMCFDREWVDILKVTRCKNEF